MQAPYDREVAVAALMLDDKLACRQRVLSALEELMQFDDDRELRAVVRRRYCDLTADAGETGMVPVTGRERPMLRPEAASTEARFESVSLHQIQAKASEDNGATGKATMRPADRMTGEVSRVDAGRAASATSERMDATGGESAATYSGVAA